jgi:NADPH:quinone reductase-like Zn-dependent oxidoreductase
MNAMGVMEPNAMPRLFRVAEPAAAPDGVVVDVMAASGDYVAGRVSAVGDDVDYIEVGMYVAGAIGPRAPRPSRTFIDKVAVPASMVAPVPHGMTVGEAVRVGMAAVAALDAISALGAARLGSVVIHGAVHGVGGFAIQLAKAHDAVVVAVAPASQVDLAWRLGADVVIPEGAMATESVQAVRRFFGSGVDTAIHVAGDPTVTAGVVRRGGKITSVDDTATWASRPGDGYVPTIVAPTGHKLADLLFKVAAGRLTTATSSPRR